MRRALTWLALAGAFASATSLLGGCEEEAPPARLGAGGTGGGSGPSSGSGAAPDQDPNAANAACLAQLGGMGMMGNMGIDCSDPGDTMFTWAFDHAVGPVYAACGRIAGDQQISARFIEESQGVSLHALRLRPGNWEAPDDGTWIEFIPPNPVPVTNENPLPTELTGWTVSVTSRTEDTAGGAGGAGGNQGNGGSGGNEPPRGLGWLFDQMESQSVEISFEAPLSADNLVNGVEVSIHFTISGGDYLRVDQENEERILTSEPGAVGEGCARGGLGPITETDDVRETPCGPSFDSCAGGTQVCNLNSGHTLMTCEPLVDCEVTCPFSCGATGSGDCGD